MSPLREARRLIDAEEFERAIAPLRPLAEAGDSQAQHLLGSLFWQGADVSWEESRRWLELAAKQDHPGAIFELATTGYDPKDGKVCWGEAPVSPQAVVELRRAADLGNVDAQRVLGINLCLGEGYLEKDEVEGRLWYGRAAKHGDIRAQVEIGQMLLAGEGGKQDIPGGLAWLEQAASADELDPSVQRAADVLAYIYETGVYGVPIDGNRSMRMKERTEQFDRAWKERFGE